MVDAVRYPGEVRPTEPRFEALVRKRFNKRFESRPDVYAVVSSAADVVAAVERAVANDARVTVQSGGHCLDGLVSDPEMRVVLDTSLLARVEFDSEHGAISVGAGATLGELQRKLFVGWGVFLPAGQSPDIGVGGHILGGGFGFHHREHGLAVDHLHGVEVVVVDEAGKARAVTATRDPQDPNHELFWAHTGCGGGNFGVVTRYLLRSPGVEGDDSSRLLPRAPAEVLTFESKWDWTELEQGRFSALIRDYGAWCEANGAVDSDFARLFSVLVASRPPHGNVTVRGVVTAGAEAERLAEHHLNALEADAGQGVRRDVQRLSWLDFALDPFPELFASGPVGVSAGNVLMKAKDATLRRRHTDAQIAVAHEYLTRRDPAVQGGALGLATLGGRMNAIAPGATAFAQRRSVMTTSYNVGWGAPADGAASLAWVRGLYRDVFEDSGGVPAPGADYEGALINHPDLDLADPSLNPSGVPWSRLYYGDNYARLQRAKAAWDPRNVFRHGLSIRV